MDMHITADTLRGQKIELPSWAFGNSGTRFKVFPQPGLPRNPYEKLADAAQVHRHTGVTPSMALHIPWDAVEDYQDLAKAASDLGMQLGTINANVFQDDDYRLGSVTNPDPRIRRKALEHLLGCVNVMDQTGSRDLKLWFADGTNVSCSESSPGQDRPASAGSCSARIPGASSAGPRARIIPCAGPSPPAGNGPATGSSSRRSSRRT
jgi:L-rhamnose isomerase / sugar isomerase